jgi:hypothetical protein
MMMMYHFDDGDISVSMTVTMIGLFSHLYLRVVGWYKEGD